MRLGALDTLRTTAEKLKAEVTENELRTRELELSIRQSDSEILNLNGKLGAIRNNAEYQAILFQVEAVKKERDGYEEESLGLLDKLGALEEGASKASGAVEADERVFTEFKAESEQLLAAQDAEIEKISHGRDDLVHGVPEEILDEYTRLFEVRDNLAICAAESQYCQGCFTQFTVNDLARLQGGRAIVRCSTCQRILYLAE